MQTAELLRKVRRLEIRSRHLVEDLFAGQSESVFKGRGMEFEEVRPYVPGDETRDIDWNVTARLGSPYVKRFVEERELTVMLVVDVSRSMRFGSAALDKWELAAELCAVLGFAAARHNDRVGLALSGERVEHFVPPARGRTHLLRLLRDILGTEPAARRTLPADTARFLSRTLRRHSLVFWLSDFGEAPDPRPWRVLARRHDLTALLLGDPRDLDLPAVGWVQLEDLESGRTTLVDAGSRRVRERYRREGEAHRHEVERALDAARVPLVTLDTGASYLPALLRYFHARRRRRAR